jgi:dTDP-4-dehydrorhamnose reductase
MVRILVTGSNGFLGHRLVASLRLRTDVELIATSLGPDRRSDTEGYLYVPLDVTSEQAVQEVCGRYRPDAIIHTAAITQVDQAEQQPARCRRLNVGAVAHLVSACARYGIHLLQLSTDFVFDGLSGPYAESDPVSPISVYGWSKAAAEKLLSDSEISWAVVRTILVYGQEVPGGRSNIVQWATKVLQSGSPVQVVNDQYRTPTFVEDLAQACIEIALRKEQGIFHISGEEEVSIFELVGHVAQHLGLSMEKVQSVNSSDLAGAELRPPRTGFILGKAKSRIHFEPVSLETGLTKVLGPAIQ